MPFLIPKRVSFCLSLVLSALLIGCGPDEEADPNGGAKPATGTAPDSGKPNGGSRQQSRPGTQPAVTKPTGILPAFRMLGLESGFRFQRYDDFQGQRRIFETNGGGVALFDFDQDGWLDTFLTNGCRLPLSRDDNSTPGELFRNLGGMKFEPVAKNSLLMQFGQAHGCAVGDFDADGFDDLYITAFGRNTFWQNNGDGTFTDVTKETGTAVPQWSSSAAFADVNGDGHLDLYVVNYLDESDKTPRLCPDENSPTGYVGCAPSLFDGVDDVLFLSDGSGRLADCSTECGIAGLKGKGLGVVIMDLDGDLVPEIYVANDSQANFLFARDDGEASSPQVPGVERVPHFKDRALASAVALNEAGFAQASMGIAAGDCDGDGRPDLFLTHFFGDTNTLYLNQGGLFFEDSTRGSRLGTTSRRTLGFGTAFLDCDNDGWLDLLVTNGHVDDRTWRSREPYRMPPQLYRSRRDGSFEDVSRWSGEFFGRKWIGRGLAIGDLDRDGRIDAVISHQADASAVLRNETPSGNAIVLRLVGTNSNRNGLGARVEVVSPGSMPQIRQLAGGKGFQSASALQMHLGIGQKRSATLQIAWPSGQVDTHEDLKPGAFVAVEGRGALRLK